VRHHLASAGAVRIVGDNTVRHMSPSVGHRRMDVDSACHTLHLDLPPTTVFGFHQSMTLKSTETVWSGGVFCGTELWISW
jgi:hypothetical protein